MSTNNQVRSQYLDTLLKDPEFLERTLCSEGVPGIKQALGSSYAKVLRSRGLWEKFVELRKKFSKRTYSNSQLDSFVALLNNQLEEIHSVYKRCGYSALEEMFNGHVSRVFERAGLSSVLEQWKSEPHYTKPSFGQNPEKAAYHADLFLNPINLEQLHQLYLKEGSDALSEKLQSDNIGNCFKTFGMLDVWKQWQLEPHRTFHSFSASKTEQEIQQFLESKGVRVLRNQRFLKNGQEIDIYLPDYKLGIEVNGVQFHLTGDPVEKLSHFTRFHERTYHSNKTTSALESGVQLLHYWSFQSMSVFKSILLAKIGMVTTVYARKLSVRPLSSSENTSFFQSNHIDGATISRGFGLVDDNDKIYCAIALRRQPRTHFCEIARFANLKGYRVVGGYSKLIKHTTSNVSTLVSYCNRDLTPSVEASVYNRLGFTFERDTGPVLRYWVYRSVAGLSPGVYDRRVFQKSSLYKLFPDYTGGPIDEFLRSKEIYPFHNSGNWKFVLKKSDK